MEELVGRIVQMFLALTGAYALALWFALVIWTYRDITTRSTSAVTHIFSTLVVVLFWVPGAVIYLLLRPKETLDEAFQRGVEEEYLLQDLDDSQTCPSCGRTVRDDFAYCPHCRARLRSECPGCHRLADLRWEICPYCATVLPAPSSPVTQLHGRDGDRHSAAPAGLQTIEGYRSSGRQHEIDETLDTAEPSAPAASSVPTGSSRQVSPRAARAPGSAPRQAGSDN